MKIDVRKGNIVGYDRPLYKGVPFIIQSIHDSGVILRKIRQEKNDKIIDCHHLAILPIPITPLRLRKFHFTQIGNQFVLNGCWITPLPDDFFLIKIGQFQQTISTVHRLQNIFFKETGLELALPEY